MLKIFTILLRYSNFKLYFFVLFFVGSIFSREDINYISKNSNNSQDSSFVITDSQFFNWSKTFADVFEIMSKKYYLAISPQDAMVKALDAFVHCDPHSRFLYELEYKEIIDSTQGEFCGIGVLISPKETKDESISIIDTVTDGPAEKDGLEAGDQIVAIEEELVQDMSLEEVISKLKGIRGSKVHITILREDKLKEFTLTRDTIKDEGVRCYYFPDTHSYYLSINNFSSLTAQDLEKYLKKIVEDKSKGIIIDLRNNSGGLLDSAIDCLGLFVPKKSIVVSTKNRHGEVTEQFLTKRAPINLDGMPIFVLVNNFTASASEILAANLRIFSKNTRFLRTPLYAFIVGTQTFGKGSVQEVIPLNSKSALKITTGLYYVADGTSLQSEGVMPDFIIDQKSLPTQHNNNFVKLFGRENKLRNTLVNPEKKNKKNKIDLKKFTEKKDPKVKRLEKLRMDYQIQQSLNFINIFYLAKNYASKEISSHQKAINFLKQYGVTDEIKIEELIL